MRRILETERLRLRELDPLEDAEFICELLNTPKFHKYIGDRGVRNVQDAAEIISSRYVPTYEENGFGFYAVELRAEDRTIGICGYVQRDTLPGPDLGFAFMPQFEGKGYGHESSSAMLEYGRDTLGFKKVLAITSLDNAASIALLTKLGFKLDKVIDSDGEQLNLFFLEL